MRYFTDNPLERMMMEVPRSQGGGPPGLAAGLLVCRRTIPAMAASAMARAVSCPAIGV